MKKMMEKERSKWSNPENKILFWGILAILVVAILFAIIYNIILMHFQYTDYNVVIDKANVLSAEDIPIVEKYLQFDYKHPIALYTEKIEGAFDKNYPSEEIYKEIFGNKCDNGIILCFLYSEDLSQYSVRVYQGDKSNLKFDSEDKLLQESIPSRNNFSSESAWVLKSAQSFSRYTLSDFLAKLICLIFGGLVMLLIIILLSAVNFLAKKTLMKYYEEDNG